MRRVCDGRGSELPVNKIDLGYTLTIRHLGDLRVTDEDATDAIR